MDQYQRPTNVREAQQNPRYQGKIIVAAGGEVYGTKSGDKANALIGKLARKYPNKKIEVGFIKQADQILIPTLVKVE